MSNIKEKLPFMLVVLPRSWLNIVFFTSGLHKRYSSFLLIIDKRFNEMLFKEEVLDDYSITETSTWS